MIAAGPDVAVFVVTATARPAFHVVADVRRAGLTRPHVADDGHAIHDVPFDAEPVAVVRSCG